MIDLHCFLDGNIASFLFAHLIVVITYNLFDSSYFRNNKKIEYVALQDVNHIILK